MEGNLLKWRRAARAVSATMAAGLITALAGAPAPALGVVTTEDSAAAPVRVATFNICKTTCGKGQFTWENRRQALVRTIAEAQPDVLEVQEANTKLWNGIQHIDDVIALLAPLGYQIASTDFTQCTLYCTRGAHVFYKVATMRLATLNSPFPVAGMAGMSQIAAAPLGSIQDRAVSWAFLTPNGSNRTTLFVSVHLATQKNSEGEAARVAVAQHLRPWADAVTAASGLTGVNLVIAGDFNSYERRQPMGAQRIVADSGLYNGYQAPVRVNGDIGSQNYAPKINKYKGFPPKPYRYKKNTTHIDYVFSSVPPLRHEVVVHLLPDGTFDNAYRVSDHNMVMVDLGLR